jgi:hypothetical protein
MIIVDGSLAMGIKRGGEQGMRKAIAILLLVALISIIAFGPVDAGNANANGNDFAPG